MHLPDGVEPANLADLPTQVALKDACLAALRAAGIDQWDEQYPSAERLAADLAGGGVFLLREEGGCIGSIVIDESLDPLWSGLDWSRAARPAAVHRLMIHPSRQRKGLAKKLMLFAEDFARDRGCDALRLDAFSANPASLALYDRLGFRRTGAASMRKGLFLGFEKVLTTQEPL